MKTLWFKGCYVEAILSGDKTDTVRPIGKRPPPRVGELLGLSVGARPAFAAAVITGVEDISADELDPERRAAVVDHCGCAGAARFRRISFRVLRPSPRTPAPRPAAAGPRTRSRP